MYFRDLKLGQLARVTAYAGISKSLTNRLIALGLHRGAPFSIVRKAPLGDPVQIQVGMTSFSVRLAEIASLEVQLLP